MPLGIWPIFADGVGYGSTAPSELKTGEAATRHSLRCAVLASNLYIIFCLLHYFSFICTLNKAYYSF